MDLLRIEYRFELPDGRTETYDLHIDPVKLVLRHPIPTSLPDWTMLDFHQCETCPLTSEAHPHCPVAVRLAMVVSGFDDLKSFDKIRVEVVTPERRLRQETTVQKGISSLMGLLIATSGCPWTVFLKPMARFHLPLASHDETIYRASSMYMLAQYFILKADRQPDLSLTNLSTFYRRLQKINTAMADRLRAASRTDSTVNAIILLDMFAKTMPYAIEDRLDELAHLFDAYLSEPLPSA